MTLICAAAGSFWVGAGIVFHHPGSLGIGLLFWLFGGLNLWLSKLEDK
jgi:hypothetical protein